MMKLIPFPIVSAALALSWLALTELSLAHSVMAVAVAIVIPLATASFLPGLPRLRRPLPALRLLAHVLWDVVVANVVVARLVLGPVRRLRPAFVEVPLAVSNPYAVTLLASIITITPGTVSVALAPDARALHVHALSPEDPTELVARIKQRYEQPLLEILEC